MIRLLVSFSICLSSAAVTFPALPQLQVDTSFPSTPGTVWSIGCTAGTGNGANSPGGLQYAFNNAVGGDLISMPHGCVWTGNFIVPVHTGTGYVVVESDGIASLPASGYRVGPGNASYMARIQTNANSVLAMSNDYTNSTWSLRASAYWRFVGIEVAVTSSVSWTYILAEFSGINGDQADATSLPNHIVIDRCWFHADSTNTVITNRALEADVAYFGVVDSYFNNIGAPAGGCPATVCSYTGETQAIGFVNTPGPVKLFNNYFEAATENIIFGGSEGSTATMYTPSDITIQHNFFNKNPVWGTTIINTVTAAAPSCSGNVCTLTGVNEGASGNALVVALATCENAGCTNHAMTGATISDGVNTFTLMQQSPVNNSVDMVSGVACGITSGTNTITVTLTGAAAVSNPKMWVWNVSNTTASGCYDSTSYNTSFGTGTSAYVVPPFPGTGYFDAYLSYFYSANALTIDQSSSTWFACGSSTNYCATSSFGPGGLSAPFSIQTSGTWTAAVVGLTRNINWNTKNLLEFKSGVRVLVTDNELEYSWEGVTGAQQYGVGMDITPRQQQGGWWINVTDVTYSSNVMRHVGKFATVAGQDGFCELNGNGVPQQSVVNISGTIVTFVSGQNWSISNGQGSSFTGASFSVNGLGSYLFTRTSDTTGTINVNLGTVNNASFTLICSISGPVLIANNVIDDLSFAYGGLAGGSLNGSQPYNMSLINNMLLRSDSSSVPNGSNQAYSRPIPPANTSSCAAVPVAINFALQLNVLWNEVSSDCFYSSDPRQTLGGANISGSNNINGNIVTNLGSTDMTNWTLLDATTQFSCGYTSCGGTGNQPLTLNVAHTGFSPSSSFYLSGIGPSLACFNETAILNGTPSTLCPLPVQVLKTGP